MRTIPAFLLTGMALMLSASVSADEIVSLPLFHSVGLTGDGHVAIQYGAGQRVVLVKGSTGITQIVVDEPRSGSLQIVTCRHACPAGYEPAIEITTPEIEGLAIKGDGEIEVEGTFAPLDRLGVAVSGDGSINAQALHATTVHAAVHGDGNIAISVSGELIAAVNGQGTIRYVGHPHVLSAVHNGGVIAAATSR